MPEKKEGMGEDQNWVPGEVMGRIWVQGGGWEGCLSKEQGVGEAVALGCPMRDGLWSSNDGTAW